MICAVSIYTTEHIMERKTPVIVSQYTVMWKFLVMPAWTSCEACGHQHASHMICNAIVQHLNCIATADMHAVQEYTEGEYIRVYSGIAVMWLPSLMHAMLVLARDAIRPQRTMHCIDLLRRLKVGGRM
jgi:ribosomal protein L32